MKTFLFLMLIASFLSADVVEHIKPCSNKSDGLKHSIRNVDFIYLINLDQNPEKLKSALLQLNPLGIRPYRFSAVNGWELSLEDIDDIGLKYSMEMQGGFLAKNTHLRDEVIQNFGQTYFGPSMTHSAMGRWLSHFSILQDAYDSGYETVWVMEDAIEIKRDPRMLCDFIEELDELVGKGNWDVLFTDSDKHGETGEYVTCDSIVQRPDYESPNDFAMKRDINADFRQIGARYGSHSMIIRRSGIKKLLKFMTAHQLFLPYDLEYVLPPGIKLFVVSQDVVTNRW